jgi:chitin synthase
VSLYIIAQMHGIFLAYAVELSRSLFHGNLVLECPVPSALLELCPLSHRQEQEFSVMRYTAVTCDPNDFEAERYTLRQKQLYEPTRRTEIFIVITMYNVGYFTS